MTTHLSHAAPMRTRRLAGLLLLAIAPLAAVGCGGDDDSAAGESDAPAACASLETLSGDVDELQAIDLEAGEGAVADIEESFDSIRADLNAVKADAEAELSEPLTSLEGVLDALGTDVEALQTAGDVTSESAQGLVDSLAAVSAAWEGVTTAVPECDL